MLVSIIDKAESYILAYLLGILTASFFAWLRCKNNRIDGIDIARIIVGIVIVLVWGVANSLSMLSKYDVPIFLHFLFTVIVMFLFDRKGTIVQIIVDSVGRFVSKK